MLWIITNLDNHLWIGNKTKYNVFGNGDGRNVKKNTVGKATATIFPNLLPSTIKSPRFDSFKESTANITPQNVNHKIDVALKYILYTND